MEKLKQKWKPHNLKNFVSREKKSDLKFVYSENNTLSIIFSNNNDFLGVMGEFNNNIKELEKVTNTSIYSRGNSIILKNDQKKNEIIKNAISFLYDQYIINGTIEKKDIISSINKFMIDEKNNHKENINYIIKTPKKSVIPRSEKQKSYVKSLRESDVVISSGPAGTGKTFLAVASAVKMYTDEKIKKIVLTRPAVEAGERLGYLPGDLSQKIDPYLVPLFDSLEYFFGNETLQYLIDKRNIEIVPLAYMRGRTLNNACIILDEAQNATVSQIKMFLTRLGEDSKMIITGDETQIDLNNRDFSGLKKTRKSLSNIEEISVVEFKNSDIVRNKIVSKILEVFPDK